MNQSRSTEPLAAASNRVGGRRAGHRLPGRRLSLRTLFAPGARRAASGVTVVGLVIGGSFLVAAPASAQVATLWGGVSPAAYISEDEGRPLTLGTRFTADVGGLALGVRFWKDAGADGTHDGALWSGDGRQLATVTFDRESESGWQAASFDEAVRLVAGQEYVVAYHEPDGEYAATMGYYGSSRSDELSVREGASGVFAYGETTRFPTSTWRSSQYWVDVTFRPDRPAHRWWSRWWGGPWWGGGTPSPSATTPAPSPSQGPTGGPTGGPTPLPGENPGPAPTSTPTEAPPSPTPTVTPTEAPASPTPSATPSPSATPPRPTPSATPPRPTPSATPPRPTPSATPSPTPPPSPTSAPPADRPGPATTGVPDGRALAPAGSMTITQAGAVIDGMAVSGTITVAAPNVVIRNSTVSGTGWYGVYVRSGSATITDTTITGFENAIAGDSWTAKRVDIYATTGDGVKLGSNVSLLDSWIHDLTPDAGAHADGAQLQSGETNVLVRGNTIDVSADDSANSALFIAPDLGPSAPGPVVIDGNWLDGGNYTVFLLDGDDGRYVIDQISLTGNAFGRAARYGPLHVNVPATISGNVWADTRAPLSW